MSRIVAAFALGLAGAAWSIQAGVAAVLGRFGGSDFIGPALALPLFAIAGALSPRPRWTLHAAWALGLVLGLPALYGNPWLGSRAGTMLGTTLVAVVAVAIGESLQAYRRTRPPPSQGATTRAGAASKRRPPGRPPHP